VQQGLKDMKKILFTALALASFSAVAEPQGVFDAILSGSLVTNQISSNGFSDTSTRPNFRTSFSYIHQSGYGVQVDNVIDNQKVDFDAGGAANIDISTHEMAIHAYYAKQNYKIGLQHQTRKFEIEMNGMTLTAPIDRAFTGIEGQYDHKNLSFYALTARDSVSFIYTNGKGRTNILEARYFFDENLRTDISYARSKFNDFDGDLKSNTMRVGAEYKMPASAWSFFANYQKMDCVLVDTDRFTVGMSFNLAKDTLKSRNSSGASFNPVSLDNQLLSFLGAI
jgi:opacity protein-like surface antigen